jgi:FAD/FMN-containing dehydrogenase
VPVAKAIQHNVTGNAVVDGGLMIDLSAMKATRVDPARRVIVTDPGLTWKDFDLATQPFGLATTGGIISSTGVAGLTLGGGHGWLMRRYGLTATTSSRSSSSPRMASS